MRTRTLAELRTEARQRADMENATEFLSDAEVNRYINESITDLYDLLIDHSPHDYYLASVDVSTTANLQWVIPDASTYPIYQIRGIDLVEGTRVSRLHPLNLQQRNLFRDSVYAAGSGTGKPKLYRYSGVASSSSGVYSHNLYLYPTPDAVYTVRIWYIPHAPVLDNDADVWDGFNGWEEYVIVDAAIKCLEKEESDTSALQLRLQRLRERIISLSTNKDASESDKILDVEQFWLDFGIEDWRE